MIQSSTDATSAFKRINLAAVVEAIPAPVAAVVPGVAQGVAAGAGPGARASLEARASPAARASLHQSHVQSLAPSLWIAGPDQDRCQRIDINIKEMVDVLMFIMD